MKRKIMLLLACLFVGIGLATAQTQTVTGVVISEEDGQPVIGASVLVKDTQLGTITGIDGDFKLTNVPSSAKTIVVSYLGMKAVEVPIKENIKVTLKTDNEMLDEVVITSYGTAKKVGSVVGSVGTVSNKKLEKPVTANFTDALSGQVAGLSVMSSSGDPSKSATIRLRGVSSINAGTAPLFILDGAPISSTLFNTLNPSDIENITVLKDAASTAIYGSRAANGVIVITSKKGKFGQKPKVTIRGQYGFTSMVEDKLDMMNASQYVEFRDKIGVPVSPEVKDLVNKYGIDTNWRDEIFKTGNTYTLDASVTGGGENVSYYLSLNHHEQDGIIDQSGMRREALRFNFNTRVADWFKVGLQSNLGYQKYETNSENGASDGLYTTDPVLFARMAFPYDTYEEYTLENGKAVFNGNYAKKLHYTGFTTPRFVNENRQQYRTIVTANLNLFQEITPIKGLTIRAQQALDAFDYTLNSKSLPYDEQFTIWGDKIAARTGSAQKAFERYYQFTYTNTAEYKFNINDHNVTLLAGQESIISKDDYFGVYATGHSDVRQMRLDQATTVSVSNLSDELTETVFNSYFFNGAYNYDERYFFDFTLRRDGSSKFAPDNRWSTFYSVGGMWNAKREKFLEDTDWLDELTLKASYGTTGNSSIGNYGYFGLIGSGSKPYNGGGTLGIAQASNYDLTWETVKQFNVGLSFRIFDRVSVDAEYYVKKTEDMLMEIPYSYTTGFSGGMGNIGSMENKGFDLSVKYDVIDTQDINWSVRANVNYNKNEITELFDGRDEFVLPNYGLMYKVGHDMGELYYVRYAGVDPRDGLQMWYDKDGNKTKVFNEERDAVLIGKSMYAPWSGGFGTEFSWKGLSISADFAYALDKYMLSNDNYFTKNTQQCTSQNQAVEMLNIWTKPGDITNIPKYGEQPQFDTRLVEDASFLRLKNVTIQYTLPKSLLKRTGIGGVNIFAIGRNLFTWTGYSGYDPEPEVNLVKFNYPNTRQIVFGAEITF